MSKLYKMADRASLQQGNPRAVAVRVVQHIRGRGALVLWMIVQVVRHLLDHNTRHFHLLLNTGCDSHKAHQTRHQLLGHYTRNEAKVEWEWNEMVV